MPEEKSDYLEHEDEHRILSCILKYPLDMLDVSDVFKADHFSGNDTKPLAGMLEEYLFRHGRFPKHNILLKYVEAKILREGDEHGQLSQVYRFIKDLHKANFDDFPEDGTEAAEVVGSLYDSHVRRHTRNKIMGEIIEDFGKDVDIEVMANKMTRLNAEFQGTRDNDLGFSLEDDWDFMIDQVMDDDNRQARTIPTGMPQLDAIMRGGPRRGELICFLGRHKLGKSFVLANLGARAVTRIESLKVVHYSLELQAERVFERYLTYLTKCSIDELDRASPRVLKKAKKRITGSLYCKFWPTRSAGYSDMVHHLTRLEQRKKFKPDVIIVDYGDIMKAERRTESAWAAAAGTFEDLREMASRFDCVVITATQAKSSAIDATLTTTSHTAEADEKNRIVDAMISISQTEEEHRDNMWRFYMAAIRNGEGGQVIPCNLDLSKCMIEPLDPRGLNDEEMGRTSRNRRRRQRGNENPQRDRNLDESESEDLVGNIEDVETDERERRERFESDDDDE